MPAFVAFLRAVNVSGRSTVRMSEVARVSRTLGFERERTILASGNLTFRAPSTSTGSLEHSLEGALGRHLGIETIVFVRDARTWEEVVRENPFPELALEDPGRLVVTVLKEAATPKQWAALATAVPGKERVSGRGRHGYVHFPDGQGRSRLTTGLIERHLETRVTNRNWNTVLRVSEALGQ